VDFRVGYITGNWPAKKIFRRSLFLHMARFFRGQLLIIQDILAILAAFLRRVGKPA